MNFNARIAKLEKASAARAQRDAAARAVSAARGRLLESLFPEQRAFVEDTSRWKACQCTRRAGKTWSIGVSIILAGIENPGCDILYIGLTNDAARRALVRQVLRPLNERFGIGLQFVNQDLIARFPNGSQLYILGLDANQGLSDRLLGGKYKLVIIDEGQSFTVDVREVVDDKVGPGLNDLDGTLILAGTAGNLLTSYYYDVCHGLLPRWSLHKWSAAANPAQRRQHLAALAQAKEEGREDDPGFRQNYLNEWAVETSAKVYAYDPVKNLYDSLPQLPANGWHHAVGVDTGHTDDFAWAVLAWHSQDHRLFVELAGKEPGLDISAAAERLQELRARYHPERMIVDGANALAVAELRRRHALPLEAADKHSKSKVGFIDLLNADLRRGLLLLHRKETVPLQEEMGALIWDPRILARTGKRVELSSLANHCCDSLTYAHRHCYQYLAQAAPPKKDPYAEDEFIEQQPAADFLGGQNLADLATPWSQSTW